METEDPYVNKFGSFEDLYTVHLTHFVNAAHEVSDTPELVELSQQTSQIFELISVVMKYSLNAKKPN